MIPALTAMSQDVGDGQSSQTINAPDLISLAYFEMDGYSFCGERTYAIDPVETWMKLAGDTLTVVSQDSQDHIDSNVFTVTVTLKDYGTVSDSAVFDAGLTCPSGSICNSAASALSLKVPATLPQTSTSRTTLAMREGTPGGEERTYEWYVPY